MQSWPIWARDRAFAAEQKSLTLYAVVQEQSAPHNATLTNLSGDYGGGDPPVPIPNTEVKPSSVEDTCGAIYRENRSLPD